MEIVDIHEFAKFRKKEHRMKNDKIKEAARQQIEESQDNIRIRSSRRNTHMKYNYEEDIDRYLVES